MRLAYGFIFSVIIAATAVCAVIARRSGKRIGNAAFGLLVPLILPMAGNLLLILSYNRQLSYAGCYLYYIGLDLSIAALLHYTFVYCDYSRPRQWIRNTIYGLLATDIVQLLLNPFFYHAFDITEMEVDGLPYYKMIPYLGQQFHRAVDYLLLFGIIVVFVIMLTRAPKLQRERYSIILFALVLVSAWETVYIFSGAPIDRSMIGFGVFGLLIFYFSLYYRPVRLLDRMLSSVVSNQKDPMYFFDKDQNCIWMNTAGQEFLKLDEQEMDRVGNMLEETFGSRHPGAARWMDQLTLNRDGEILHIELSKEPLYDSERKMNGFCIHIHDQTEEQRETAQKLYNARHDRLTGVINRDYLYELTRDMLAENPDESYLIIRAEINDLKVINDLYGNTFGDYALKSAADWLRTDGNLPPGSVYGRLGGESFGVCLPEKHFSQRRTEEKLSEFAVKEDAREYRMLIHVGIYRVTDRDLDVSVMYDRAQLAVESIKDDYHFHIAWYNESMREQVVWNRLISGELNAALKEGLIRPWLQPIVDREGKPIGAEALVRWIQPDEGVRSPFSFIPVFEKNGMIAEVDRFIWRKSCEILARWKRERKDLFISVNISPKDFYLMNVPSELMRLVLEYDVDPASLRLEITESVMMGDEKGQLDNLRKLQDAGFIIEMDDFGSGYSSLNMLREMPVDVLKIDMVFLQRTGQNDRAKTIVGQIINMAKELGIVPLIEGVETKEQYDVLRKMGCQMYQGYYFASPMPVGDFEYYLSGRQKSQQT